MFTSQAYKNPSVMVTSLKNYLSSIGANNNWNDSYLEGLLILVDESYEDQYSIFKFDETIVEDMLIQFQSEFEKYTSDYTNGMVSTIPKFAKVYNLLGELIGSADFIAKTDSTSRIAKDQFDELQVEIKEKSDNTFSTLLPFVGIGAVLYFIAPRIIEAIGEEQRK